MTNEFFAGSNPFLTETDKRVLVGLLAGPAHGIDLDYRLKVPSQSLGSYSSPSLRALARRGYVSRRPVRTALVNTLTDAGRALAQGIVTGTDETRSGSVEQSEIEPVPKDAPK